jgi:hypothetical protein
MTARTSRLTLAALAVLVLSACSAAVGADPTSSASGGTIELAVSETCVEGSSPQCVSVKGENVVVPTTFERAGVKDASVVDNDGNNAVGVTFDDAGAAVLHALTEKAAQAGSSARLVMKIGGELQNAVAVMQALEGDYVQIALAADDSAQDLVDLINGK